VSDYAKSGAVQGPGGEDKIPVRIGRSEQWLTADEVLKLTEETRGGEDPLGWKVSPEAISEAEDRGAPQ
jgi:hypothetical protein